MAAPNDIIVYHYPYSPYARRIIWYLTLRGIQYAQCLQPPVMPRPDIAALGISYRRIPVVSIGRDVYADTRLILEKLEQRFPNGALGAKDSEHKALEKLLSRWIIDGDVFKRAAGLIPVDMPIMKDPKFIKDREGFSGRPWSKEALEKAIPENLIVIRDAFHMLETTLLADRRDWVLRTETPSLADIEAIWVFDWLIEMKGALPPNVISDRQFPHVFAWIKRFRAALNRAKSSMPKPVTLKGDAAAKHIVEAEVAENTNEVDINDPLGLQQGEAVEVFPVDSGFTHRDTGRLMALTSDEVVLAVKPKVSEREVRLHVPRRGFRVVKGKAAKL